MTNKQGKPSDIDIGIKEVVHDSSGSSIKSDCVSKIKIIRTQNKSNVIIGNLNINSLSSKFDDMKMFMTGMFDILVITETKLDITFPVLQFHIDGFSMPYRLDRNKNGSGVNVYVREDIPSKLLSKHCFKNDIEGLFVEVNLRKIKWFLGGIYHPPSQPDQYFFDSLDKALDISCSYEKVVLVGDFDAKIGETCLDNFLFQHELQSINKEPTCFKNAHNPSCIDLILTNSPRSFFKTETLFTGLSDFHKLVTAVFKTTFLKSKPKEIIYRDFKKFSEESFNEELSLKLTNECVNDYSSFENIFLDTLNHHAPVNKKLLKANHALYITKTLRKAIMRRSNLQTKYFKTRTPESLKKYRKQKNYCIRLYKKERKTFFNDLKVSNMSDNKTFWKNIQPIFSENPKIANKITLVGDNENIISDSVRKIKQLFSKCHQNSQHN